MTNCALAVYRPDSRIWGLHRVTLTIFCASSSCFVAVHIVNYHVVCFLNANNGSSCRGTRKEIPKNKFSKADIKLVQDLPERGRKAKGSDQFEKQNTNQSMCCLGANGSVRWRSVTSFVPQASRHLLSTHRPSHRKSLITACHYIWLHLSL